MFVDFKHPISISNVAFTYLLKSKQLSISIISIKDIINEFNFFDSFIMALELSSQYQLDRIITF